MAKGQFFSSNDHDAGSQHYVHTVNEEFRYSTQYAQYLQTHNSEIAFHSGVIGITYMLLNLKLVVDDTAPTKYESRCIFLIFFLRITHMGNKHMNTVNSLMSERINVCVFLRQNHVRRD